ncbi:rabankyrin-5-like isoform X3 [Dreissena polymorpha]|uniref:rabankyrin-5-like isoform X3 n=1 Tax=Dreissena polymorpha TaxID=45954 RepID=UPI0022647EBE|nr:rabankyrin-5-like isoform X3 [Dreissena polymorpha]
MADGEVTKLQNHLRLLREEYVKLQKRLADVEKKYQVLSASAGQSGDNNFVTRLLNTVADLFDKPLYSDLVVHLEGGHSIHGHRFVLAARSDCWGVEDLSKVAELHITDIQYKVSYALMKWVYTDDINIESDSGFLLDLLRAATRFKLEHLRQRCENGLMSYVNMKNCIQFYQTAEEMNAVLLKSHCSELISNHWNDFTSEDFATMPAALLYKMFKAKTDYPLHTAIRARREDVVFLYLIEFDSQLSVKLNEVDTKGDLPLDLALKSRQESIAQTLISHHVDTSRRDNTGRALLHKAIKRGDEFSSMFLIKNKADVNMVTHLDKESPLHMAASLNPALTSEEVMAGLARICELLLGTGAHVNAQDAAGSTPLHNAIFCKNRPVFDVLIQKGRPDLELKNADGFTVLWLALQEGESVDGRTEDLYGENSFAACLLKHGSNPNSTEPDSGDTVLHCAARQGNEKAAIFLASHGSKPSLANHKGETPLHIACEKGLTNLVKVLLNKGGNPNAQTRTIEPPLSSLPSELLTDADTAPVSQQTPLHLALLSNHADILAIFLQFKLFLLVEAAQCSENNKVIPNFNIKDSDGQTVLGLALWSHLYEESAKLLGAGANINEKNSDGLTLLHQAIEKQDISGALFLIEHQADLAMKTSENQTPLQHAIERHLPVVVEVLCQRGVDMDMVDDHGNCPLWQALDTGQEDIAQTLVKQGCDVDLWLPGPGGCHQSLLHRAIDQNNEPVACFLIRSKCDLNSPRRPGPNGEGGEEARDGSTPLHLACAWGMELVVQTLMEHGVAVNTQDIDGKTPVHIAIENQHAVIISLLLSHPSLDLTIRDKHGLTPFASAMTTRNNKAAQSILSREQKAAEQIDNKGRNFLHCAIMNKDIESVLFLIGVHANVNSRVNDSKHLTPLHLAVDVGADIIVRNLLLAGAEINAHTNDKQTSLHLAASKDHSVICTILLENGVDFDALDENGDNALHKAVRNGNINSVRVLLTECSINAEVVNQKGQNPLHVLGAYGKDNAAAIYELFKESMPEYPIAKLDAEGNTVLLLAYMNGNGALCRTLVRAGSPLGTVNKQGLSVFNVPVATKQLLFKMLDMLAKEPPWSDGEMCLECTVKFSLKNRKHHCRHCGRLLCAKCSSKDMPIIKYNLSKPVRVCDVCFDVLSIGGTF